MQTYQRVLPVLVALGTALLGLLIAGLVFLGVLGVITLGVLVSIL